MIKAKALTTNAKNHPLPSFKEYETNGEEGIEDPFSNSTRWCNYEG